MRWLIALAASVACMYILKNWTSFCFDPLLPCDDCVSSFRNKHVLITGASRGIGRELTLLYCSHGAKVTITARSASALKEVEKACREKGATSVFVMAGDMSDRTFPEKLIRESMKQTGLKLELLLINHAIVRYEYFEECKTGSDLEDRHMSIFETNLLGSIRLVHAALPYLHASDSMARIVGVSSLGVYFSPCSLTGYSASKAGFQTFLEGLETELRLSNKSVYTTIVHLGEVSTQQLAEQKGNGQDYMALTPVRASELIACSAQRDIRDAYVPIESYFLSWLGIVARRFRSPMGYYGFLSQRPDLMHRLLRL